MTSALVVFHSRLGGAARGAREAAKALRAQGAQVTVEEARECVWLPYPLWLLLSFIPGAGWPIIPPENDPAKFDATLLVVPKWTLACPPVESWLAAKGRHLGRSALLVVAGGFDHERFTRVYRRKMERLGAKVVWAEPVKRRELINGQAGGIIMEMAKMLTEGEKDG